MVEIKIFTMRLLFFNNTIGKCVLKRTSHLQKNPSGIEFMVTQLFPIWWLCPWKAFWRQWESEGLRKLSVQTELWSPGWIGEGFPFSENTIYFSSLVFLHIVSAWPYWITWCLTPMSLERMSEERNEWTGWDQVCLEDSRCLGNTWRTKCLIRDASSNLCCPNVKSP